MSASTELSLIAAFVGGLLTSTSPCALAAVPVAVGFVGGQSCSPRRAWLLSSGFVMGMTIALTLLGLVAAQIGTLMGTLPGIWTALAGGFVMMLGAWMLWGTHTGWTLPMAWQHHLRTSGLWGAVILGGMMGTVMSPCATPALAAALAVAGAGSLNEGSVWYGAALLSAYGLGHSVLLLVAGALPSVAARWVQHLSPAQHWMPGQRFFASLLVVTGLWWMLQPLNVWVLG